MAPQCSRGRIRTLKDPVLTLFLSFHWFHCPQPSRPRLLALLSTAMLWYETNLDYIVRVNCWVPHPEDHQKNLLAHQSELVRFITVKLNMVLTVLVVSQKGSQGGMLIVFRSWAGWIVGGFASQRTCGVWQNLWCNSFRLLTSGRWRSRSKSCWASWLVLLSKLFWSVTVLSFRSEYYLEQVAKSFLLVLCMANLTRGKYSRFQYCFIQGQESVLALVNNITFWPTGIQACRA